MANIISRFISKLDVKDCLAAVGIGLMEWGTYRIGGATALIMATGIILLGVSGLLNILTLYCIAQVANLSCALRDSTKE